MGLALSALCAASGTLPVEGQIQIHDPWPKACARVETPFRPQTVTVPTAGDSLELTYNAAGLAGKKIAILFNGNLFPPSTYEELVEHLVDRAYVVANAQRPGGSGGNATYILGVIDEVLGALGLAPNDPDLGVALIGHSKGGRLIVEAAAQNLGDEIQRPIDALIGLAPASSAASVLNDWFMPPYMSLYGSQDEDLDGYAASVIESFRAFDQIGHESSTTCNSPPCLVTNPRVDKTMIFAYGADHAGLLGWAVSAANWLPQHTQYLDPRDQLCLTKAYTTAFLNWQLRGDSYYKGFLRDEWRPLRIKSIQTYAADALGNGAGEPLRLYHQISPRERKVIQNFQVGHGAPLASATVLVQHAAPLTSTGGPTYNRHETGAAFVGWPSAGVQFARWDVPAGSQVGSTYSHLSIRLGQVAGIAPDIPYHNHPGQDLRVYLGVSDPAGETDLFPLDVPYPDPNVDAPANARTAMSTFRIPVEDFNPELDMDQIEYVYLIMAANSQGTVMVDSIEWHRD